MDLLSPELLSIAVTLLIAGALTGMLAGMFGVGGGALIVPVLYEVFGVLDVPDETRMPLAVGTSLAIIIPTSIRSWLSHRARGAVDAALLRAWAVPIVLGVLVGATIARFAPALVFQLVFVVVAGVNAVKLISGTTRWDIATDLPKGALLRAYGWVIGLLSSLMGIGGGQIANIIMTTHGRPIHQSVATSAGIGVLISIPGAIGYMIAGWGQPGLPVDAVGFVSLIGFLLFVPTTLLTAGLGVRLAHSLSSRALQLAFGLFLMVVCLRFIYAIVVG
ncbi:sulfite exporter TauE/SafE family protein [Roseinatronobacter bogoriensis]|uniref:Probable membrane transporter protein n=1 Tax=Roseinatronobacter bogoriensis subsp. barguzinensis TaxID=441209 RepID=A0A2K8K7A0_9RHOB|nr:MULTISPECIES: sulfite exporter TauE/SafE family protein [Rhodobaca]ATX65334.1 sulfite exporter TauE/SafE family protein [Rhodobaca barguzinensis]MBB4208908.1 putative membrane protein YfcA [Rhodobaca bogoriensis DSM 18756]TDW37666.1 putative membrane protein YfcA [Rhodobaca barguzinensis]TDY68276.1 putative membrane protein YfcA [Rhodobaca bogoriensis DSM 18756]